MDDEARRADQETSVHAEDRYDVHDGLFKPPKKHVVGSLKRKLDGFESRMATIRAHLEARGELTSDQEFHLPAVHSSSKVPSAAVETWPSLDRLKFPLLRRIEHTRVANASPIDPYLEVENVLHRSITRSVYDRDAGLVTSKELAATSATNEAQKLGEEARKRMVAYTQNESGWRFEERTTRYQEVMEMKQQAEKAQREADLQRQTARQMKELLRDPYQNLRTFPVPRNLPLPPIPNLRNKKHEWIWILASLSTKLTFTPRDFMIDNEKELSMYVVYYIATSDVNNTSIETEEHWQQALKNDCPPTSGWVCGSVHGTPPVPELTALKSGIQTWTVVGAGTGHLNGKYVACGLHDRARMFKSSAGVELFRKCVPVASSLSEALHCQTARPESAASSGTSSVVLPSGLAFIEKDELDFRSMQRVGSWLSMNESIERNRRMLASQTASIDSTQVSESIRGSPIDGHNVMNQESRQVADDSDVVGSRSQASAPLCREWTLFGHCSRRRTNQSTETSESLMKAVGLGCLQRHYYISFKEKKQMTVWVQTKESWLEKTVLAVIIEREAQMKRVHHLCHKCMVNFQHNLPLETEKVLRKLLAELNRVRFFSVKVLEMIDQWRKHARKVGFAHWSESSAKNFTKEAASENKPQTEAPVLGWSASITLDTGKQLYKGSNAFVSKVKRFRRSEDVTGKREQHIVYLGYYETQEEAERAYDEHAASEAHRLNTTVEHLPHRRNVFRSCGKHFAVESEKEGPSVCIECKTKQLASLAPDEWTPPFFYGSGVNYIMKMANDLDFLDDVLPLKEILNNGRGVDGEAFPLRGNVFLLPKTPVQDPDLAVFTTFPTPTAPRFGQTFNINDIDTEALDRDRIFKAQEVFLQELQIYRPELSSTSVTSQILTQNVSRSYTTQESLTPPYRLVEALYWDHCAALKIQQERPPLAMRQAKIWCRPDAGEWASLVARGAHQLHFLYQEKLEKTGKEMMQRRQQVVATLRQLNKVPLYFVPSRTKFIELIAAGHQVRGDVVQLEVNNASKRLQRYDSWCIKSLVVQRWVRGVFGRRRARATRKALHFACRLRVLYYQQIATVAASFYLAEVRTAAVRRAYKAICAPVYTRAVVMDGEPVIVTFHSLKHYEFNHKDVHNVATTKESIVISSCCTSCARRFRVQTNYQCREHKFAVLRGVCTCSWNGANDGKYNESWLIRAYNSSHNVIYRLRLETPQLEQILSSQTYSQLYPRSSISQNHALIMDMEIKQLEAARTTRYATFCLENAKVAATNVANWRRMNNEATQTRKSILVLLAKRLALLASTKSAHVVAVGNAKKALDFTSRGFSEAQAWDPLENANDWKFIVEKRKLTKHFENVRYQVERLRVESFQATHNEQYTQARACDAHDRYTRTWLPLIERASQIMEDASLQETATRTRMEKVMDLLCDRFLTLRDSYLVPTRRNLVIQSPMAYELVPYRLDFPGLRRRRNHLRRRTLMLSNQAKKTRRMVVTVSMWPCKTRRTQGLHTNRDFWVTAYDPVDCSEHSIFLDWTLVQLLTGLSDNSESSELKRSARLAIADILLSLTMLDRFTGEFTLQKLQFYHTMRHFSPQFLSSRVMRDLQAGRKCGQGDEVLRQAVAIDGRLCVVVVYENWGDLTFAIYHTASGDFFRLVMPLHQVLDLLATKPLMLRLWISCVKSNSYTSTLLVYLLKYVRFYRCLNDGIEHVRTECGLPAQKRSKCYQTVLRLQKRLILVSIREDSAGDFQISGYDVNRNFTYKLLLEREGIRRILKTSASPKDSVSNLQPNLVISTASLLLKRNRKDLYTWICSRLRFQNLLEHLEMVTAGTSPLRFGLHLRESFRILNRWISTSPRNPICAVSEAKIANWVSGIDANIFSNLQFDQLTLIGAPRLPCELEKEFVGTLDWIEAVAGTSSHAQTWTKRFPYMKMDFFVKAHTLFARLREELKEETKERKKRETWAGMEKEDHDALCIDTINLMNAAKTSISDTCQKVSDLHTAALRKITQWRQVHAELRVATKSTEVGKELDCIMAPFLDAARILEEENSGVFLDFLTLWIPTASTELHEFISLAVPFNASCPAVVAASLLGVCSNILKLQWKPKFRKFELMLERIERSDNSLEELRKLKRIVVQFCNFLKRQPVDCTVIPEDADGLNNIENKVEAKHDKVADLAITSTVNTGILIPSNSDEPIQEVFLADIPTWTPSSTSPFVVYAHTIVEHLRSFFQQVPGFRLNQRTCHSTGVLTCQRVPYGVFVYQITTRDVQSVNQSAQLNSRSVALAGGRAIYGPALFWPLQVDFGWYQRLLHSAAIYRELATISRERDLESEEMALERPVAVRSSKYLPWKQFAIERLRISLAVKRSRISEGLCVDSLRSDADEIEKEARTIAILAVEGKQLEISFGKRKFHDRISVTKCLKHYFEMHPSFYQSDSSNEVIKRQVSISNPRVLRDVLAIYDIDGNAIQIPCFGSEDKDKFKMKRIQVEIDNVDKPRRLIFSYRELQTQRSYFVDCDYYSLQYLLLQRQQKDCPAAVSLLDEVECRHEALAMNIHRWRKLAALASQFLVFRTKNGVFSLCLEVYTPEMQQNNLDEAAKVSDEEKEPETRVVENQLQKVDGIVNNFEKTSEVEAVEPRSRAEVWEERKSVERSTMLRFQTHQTAIRAAACGRMLARTSNTCARISTEWMQMTREDWRSQEFRGILMLNVSVLNKLEKAYIPATRRARDYLRSSSKEDVIGGLELQMHEIAQTMGQNALQSNDVEALQSVRMKRWRRRGKQVTAAAQRAEANLVDVAEWWRWRIATIQLETKR